MRKKRPKNKDEINPTSGVKPVKKKAVRKSAKVLVPKTRNSNTMTETQFFQWLRQVLRKASVYWRPISNTRKNAQIPYKGPNKRRKFSYVCAKCHGEFASTEVNVHHTIECGSLKTFEDLSGFAERLFIEEGEGLIVVCKKCHLKEHTK